MNAQPQYDYIIAGTGCAGFSLALRLSAMKDRNFRVLMIDQDEKTVNDRTWCFWSNESDPWFGGLATAKWSSFRVSADDIDRSLALDSYTYYAVKGIDFYAHCRETLSKDERFTFVKGTIRNICTAHGMAYITAGLKQYTARYLFNSALREPASAKGKVQMVQQFKGWFVRGAHGLANPVLMDFKIPQNGACRFMYVLPLSPSEVLVECTAFTPELMRDEDFDITISRYIEKELGMSGYAIEGKEYGEIPMYEAGFRSAFGSAVVNIGVAGNAAKPSTGYTFHFIQRDSDRLARDIVQGKPLRSFRRKRVHAIYDAIFLRVLLEKRERGWQLFQELFRRCKTEDILAFLNEESEPVQDLSVIGAMPKQPFVRQALKMAMEKVTS